jgi:hypothetical protein
MTHEDTLSCPIFERLLYCHLLIFSEGRSPYYGAKSNYCLKCMSDYQPLKTSCLVPAIKRLHELLHYNSTNKFESSEKLYFLII